MANDRQRKRGNSSGPGNVRKKTKDTRNEPEETEEQRRQREEQQAEWQRGFEEMFGDYDDVEMVRDISREDPLATIHEEDESSLQNHSQHSNVSSDPPDTEVNSFSSSSVSEHESRGEMPVDPPRNEDQPQEPAIEQRSVQETMAPMPEMGTPMPEISEPTIGESSVLPVVVHPPHVPVPSQQEVAAAVATPTAEGSSEHQGTNSTQNNGITGGDEHREPASETPASEETHSEQDNSDNADITPPQGANAGETTSEDQNRANGNNLDVQNICDAPIGQRLPPENQTFTASGIMLPEGRFNKETFQHYLVVVLAILGVECRINDIQILNFRKMPPFGTKLKCAVFALPDLFSRLLTIQINSSETSSCTISEFNEGPQHRVIVQSGDQRIENHVAFFMESASRVVPPTESTSINYTKDKLVYKCNGRDLYYTKHDLIRGLYFDSILTRFNKDERHFFKNVVVHKLFPSEP